MNRLVRRHLCGLIHYRVCRRARRLVCRLVRCCVDRQFLHLDRYVVTFLVRRPTCRPIPRRLFEGVRVEYTCRTGCEPCTYLLPRDLWTSSFTNDKSKPTVRYCNCYSL